MSTKDKPTKLERVNWTIHRAITGAQNKRAAKWVLYGTAAITTTLLFGVTDVPDPPKIPRALGD